MIRTVLSLHCRQARRLPYQENQQTLESLDLARHYSKSSTPKSSHGEVSDGGFFESVSLLSLSDQTTLDSSNCPSTTERTVVPSASLTVIERNARIIKWLFQLNKANASPSFQNVH
jgi:hypothetical protein